MNSKAFREYQDSEEIDAAAILEIATADPELAKPLHADLPYTGAEIAWAAREEMALDLDDALARRTRSLLLDASAAIEAAPRAAAILAAELGRDESWQATQVAEFTALADGYRLA